MIRAHFLNSVQSSSMAANTGSNNDQIVVKRLRSSVISQRSERINASRAPPSRRELDSRRGRRQSKGLATQSAESEIERFGRRKEEPRGTERAVVVVVMCMRSGEYGLRERVRERGLHFCVWFLVLVCESERKRERAKSGRWRDLSELGGDIEKRKCVCERERQRVGP